jgi:hypothetical protein
MTSLTREAGRRVILLFTDGYDSGSGIRPFNRANRSLIERRIDREGFMIHVVGLPSQLRITTSVGMGVVKGAGRHMNPEMKSLSVDSGGGFYEVKPADDPAKTMARVAEELHHQYWIGFQPQVLDGKAHKLTVEVKKPAMTVRSRRAYIAAPVASR